ncbi:MAG: rod shape-determining protein [Candidatus Zambryskibacteria bacterium]|nr:rod shape-determining protein [Candidatus Zambryskibacteria bacterium]
MRFLRNDIGIDLGTANMLVYVKGKGIILNEPSVVAVNQKTGQVVAVGIEAKNMLGRTPPHIIAVRPIVEGVVSDFEVTEEMIHYLLNKAQTVSKKILGPRVLVGVPSGITNVETRAVRDATKNAGASEVHIVEEPMSAAIGMHLPIRDPVGNMVIDIGGGTADIVIISLGGVVSSKNVKIAGDKLNNDIISYIRNEFKIIIGEKTAENVKTCVIALLSGEIPLETKARGRDLVTGLPKEVMVTDSDIRDAVSHSVEALIEAVKEVLEVTPPEVLSDIMRRGVYLTGGGALIKGLSDILSEETKIPVYIADNPLTCVVRGTGIILEKLEEYKDILIADENDISNKT